MLLWLKVFGWGGAGRFLSSVYGWRPALCVQTGLSRLPILQNAWGFCDFELLNVCPLGGQGFGRRLPFGSCMLFKRSKLDHLAIGGVCRVAREGWRRGAVNKSPKFKDSYFKTRAKTWAVGQAVGAAARADLREVSWGGRSRRPLAGLAGGQAGAFPQTEGWSSTCCSTALLQDVVTLLHLVETCPYFTPLLWFTCQRWYFSYTCPERCFQCWFWTKCCLCSLSLQL